MDIRHPKVLRFLAGAALVLGTSTFAHAAPTAAPPSGGASSSSAAKGPRTRHRPAPTKVEINGLLLVSDECGAESPSTVRVMRFFDRPAVLCAEWTGKKPTASAKWKLVRRPTSKRAGEEVGSGIIPAEQLGSNRVTIDLPITTLLPPRNRSKEDIVYMLQLESKLDPKDSTTTRAGSAMLVHRPKSQEPGPKVVDPYKCKGPFQKYARRVKVEIPSMAVNAITTNDTKYGGDRDEMFIAIDRLGPGPDPRHRRLPAYDDYYGAKEGNVTEGHWTNKEGEDDHIVRNPVMFNEVLHHGQIADLGISAQEQDNADLADVRNSLMEAMAQVVKAASEANNSYGAIVAGIAGLLDAGFSLIPSNAGQDMIGYAGLRLENRCGHVQATWYTVDELKVSGVGTLRNQFQSMTTHDVLGTRAVVLSLTQPIKPGNETVFEWGDYMRAGRDDEFWWKASGTNGSSYTYRVRSTIAKP